MYQVDSGLTSPPCTKSFSQFIFESGIILRVKMFNDRARKGINEHCPGQTETDGCYTQNVVNLPSLA